ncbi:MAG TPA: NUDIX domain-containing protein [Candidatus Saccharimonadales bacterium]
MKRQSAGILVYRIRDGQVEVLLGHAGGPFWNKKDKGAWSIPKGECESEEDLLTAAKREFTEETSVSVPPGELKELGFFKRKDGKTVYAWAVEGDIDPAIMVSNTFEMEWPPKSGQMQRFPEFDKAAWFPIWQAGGKMHKGQEMFLERLAELLQISLTAPVTAKIEKEPVTKNQTSLF